MIYIVDFQNKSEHVIRSKYFLEIQFLAVFSLTLKEEEAWPDGTHPILFAVKLCLHAKF